jgi:hypothetical protein
MDVRSEETHQIAQRKNVRDAIEKLAGAADAVKGEARAMRPEPVDVVSRLKVVVERMLLYIRTQSPDVRGRAIAHLGILLLPRLGCGVVLWQDLEQGA